MDGTPSADARFRSLYEEHYNVMRDYCFRRLPSDDTNDALSEIFMVAWRRLDSIPPGDQDRKGLVRVPSDAWGALSLPARTPAERLHPLRYFDSEQVKQLRQHPQREINQPEP